MPRSLRGPLLLLLLVGVPLTSTGCVMRYGEEVSVNPAEPLPPPTDFTEVKTRLESLVDAQMDVDTRDRIDAALDLLRAARVMGADGQERVLRYLQQIVAIEERSRPMEAPALFSETLPETTELFTPLTGGVQEEDLGGVEQLSAPGGSGQAADGDSGAATTPSAASGAGEGASVGDDAVGDDAVGDDDDAGTQAASGGPSDPVSQARAALSAGDPAGALAALEPCGVVDCSDDAGALRIEAQAAWIHAERERAGALFVRARSEPDASERATRLVEARQILAGLIDRFPDAEQIPAIQSNLALVLAELEAAN